MKHAGVHWPANAGGEHPNVETILSMPGIMHGCTLICADSARYWYKQARAASPFVVWRAIPRQGRLPAQLGWNAQRVADECLNLWDEQPHGGTEWFLPLNELQFIRENGAPFPGYFEMGSNLNRLRLELRKRFNGTGVRLMFPAWVPSDDTDHLNEWSFEAEGWDAICLHAYGSADTMRSRYQSYRDAFPNHGIFVGEWNANHEGHDEHAALEMWAELADTDPSFLGATYYIWETNNAGERDLSIWGDAARLALFQNPPVIQAPEEPQEPEPMTEIEQFIRDAAIKRGIDPDIAVKVAKSEGGVTDPAAHGDFETGDSWWPFQLHYGGEGYEQYGTTAGMGNGFTKLTGWQPGDPKAWRDSVRYALNRAKASGWGAWYGAAHVGVGQWDGIDKDHPWDANGEPWDYETGGGSVPATKVTYNRDLPAIAQNDPWSCAPTSTRWAMTALGRHPTEAWMEDQMKKDGIVSEAQGLLDASGKQLAAWITAQYGELGYSASSENPISWDALAAEFMAPANPYPALLGGRAWNHWTGLRSYDPQRDVLLLANPAENWQGVGSEMDRNEFARWGPFSMVRIVHPDLIGAPAQPPPPPPVLAVTRADIDAVIAQLAALRDRIPA